jgi:hypothetical protein
MIVMAFGTRFSGGLAARIPIENLLLIWCSYLSLGAGPPLEGTMKAPSAVGVKDGVIPV